MWSFVLLMCIIASVYGQCGIKHMEQCLALHVLAVTKTGYWYSYHLHFVLEM